MVGPLFDALSDSNVSTERVVCADDAVEEVRRHLLGPNGVLVWVNLRSASAACGRGRILT
jgi:hypothetical protein